MKKVALFGQSSPARAPLVLQYMYSRNTQKKKKSSPRTKNCCTFCKGCRVPRFTAAMRGEHVVNVSRREHMRKARENFYQQPPCHVLTTKTILITFHTFPQ